MIGRIGRSCGSLFFLCGVAILLAGCASFAGRPEPVTPAQETIQVVRKYPRAEAIKIFFLSDNSAREGLTRRQWRDMIVDVYIHAADARYHSFLSQLSQQTKGVNLGHDLLILGLSGGASVAGKSTANALSAAVAGLAGSRTAISKELYFEKTLPALIAGMETARSKQKNAIYSRLRTEDVDSYTLGAALSDIDGYESAASLDGGIAQVTAAATAAAAEEQQKFDPLYIAPIATDEAVALQRKIRTKLREWLSNGAKDKIDAAAAILGFEPKDDMEAQALAITTYIGEHNTVAEITSFISKVESKTGETIK